MPCPTCGRSHKRSKNGPCARCYRKEYRKTENGKKACDRADKKSVKNNPERRFAEVVRYRDKIGYYLPTDLLELNVAIKRLDKAVEAAENGTAVHEPSQRRYEQSAQRRDFARRRTDLQQLGKGCSSNSDGGRSQGPLPAPRS